MTKEEKQEIIKICKCCKKEFIAKRRSKIFCSRRCGGKEWRENNKEKASEYAKEYRENNREELDNYAKEYYENNKEEILEYAKEYRENNKEEISIKGKKYYENNKEEISIKGKEYRENHKEEISIKNKEYRENNKEEISIKGKEYYQNNKEEISIKAKKYRENHKEERNERQNNRIKTDINYKLTCNLRSRLTRAIKNNQKSGSAVDDLGCGISELILYLESKFQPGMTWDNWNYRGWHIDHIIPLSSFNLENREELLKAVNYANLQPLWAKDNISKNNKII